MSSIPSQSSFLVSPEGDCSFVLIEDDAVHFAIWKDERICGRVFWLTIPTTLAGITWLSLVGKMQGVVVVAWFWLCHFSTE
jgi:hypothetical protein